MTRSENFTRASEQPDHHRSDDANEYGLRDDRECLPPHHRFFAGAQMRVASQLRFALPERAEHHSGFLSRLEKSGRGQSERNRQEKARFAWRAHHQHQGEGRDRHDEPHNAAASTSARTAFTDVGDVLGHAALS